MSNGASFDKLRMRTFLYAIEIFVPLRNFLILSLSKDAQWFCSAFPRTAISSQALFPGTAV